MTPDQKFMAIKDLPPAPTVLAGASHILYRKTNKLLTIYANGPPWGGKIPFEFRGKLGKEVNTEQGYQAARLTALNLLLVARSLLNTLDNVDNIINIEGAVSCTNEFTEHASVINGCSDLLVDIFGEQGKNT